MPTSYDLIFPKYMHLIKDFDLTSMTETQMKVENKLTLSKAVTLFIDCRTDLSRDDTTETFVNDLSEEVQWILADYMRSVWFDEKINDGTLLKLGLSDKDFKLYSPANQLDVLGKIKKQYDKELKLRVNKYLFKKYDYSQFHR